MTIIISQPGEFWTRLHHCRNTSPCWAWSFFPVLLCLVFITLLLLIT